ncbi:septal ring lytic transglycosylase RlpA family protein [Methylacidimicrobium sp. B4]|uniref:septal ring lytic transglycosylase RlpA family protein n=1 Tax=Methylacidimicrobium sp. B4 TaxID=2796139 RepID=UPI001A8E65A5|nr:septal ring lytic transglycosylase RlpA family protein [Methylacidimicrobium sp. B4]QSR85380.1 septal ring lytic transglycosylase RlpA family protein [Methylacidimicrobium sp. B4]
MFANLTFRAAGSLARCGGFRLLSLAVLFGSLGPLAEAKTFPVPAAPALRTKGIASWYAESRFTSTGERYRPGAMTAAHPTLPFGTLVAVRNLKNGKIALVRINDRGPYKKGRIIDLSRAAADRLGMLSDGLALVELRIVRSTPRLFSSATGTLRPVSRRGPVPF